MNEEEGLRVFAQALTTNFASEFTLEDYNLADTIPCWREACLGSVEEKIVKFADPERRKAMKDVHEERGGLFGAGYDLTEIKVHWISSDVPGATELKDTYEGFTIGEIAGARGQARDRCLPRRGCGRPTPSRLRDANDFHATGINEGGRDLPRRTPRRQ